ncbi:hypothetical protein N824_16260 [Pedobacter sp. V48]|nr:hypothetical protein N824_16260 [Pedobacter sp. V48]
MQDQPNLIKVRKWPGRLFRLIKLSIARRFG